MNFEEIKKALHTLSTEQLKELSERIAALRHVSGDKPRNVTTISGPASDTHKIMLECIQTALLRAGCPAPYFMLKTASKGISFREKIKTIDAFLGAEQLTRQEKYAILRLAADLLLKDLQSHGIGLTPGTIVRCVHRIPALLNKSFPGYARLGILSMLHRRA